MPNISPRMSSIAPMPIIATPFLEIDVTDNAGLEQASRWWEELTSKGGEGMVVKPLDFIARGPKGLVQPAIKCRGREYLRIIYGPEYTADDQLPRLRSRGLSGKRSLAAREFSQTSTSLRCRRFFRSLSTYYDRFVT